MCAVRLHGSETYDEMGLIRTQDGKEDQENMVAAPLSSYVSATCPLVLTLRMMLRGPL